MVVSRVLQRDVGANVPLLAVLIVNHRMAVGEGAAAAVLAAQAHGVEGIERRGEHDQRDHPDDVRRADRDDRKEEACDASGDGEAQKRRVDDRRKAGAEDQLVPAIAHIEAGLERERHAPGEVARGVHVGGLAAVAGVAGIRGGVGDGLGVEAVGIDGRAGGAIDHAVIARQCHGHHRGASLGAGYPVCRSHNPD